MNITWKLTLKILKTTKRPRKKINKFQSKSYFKGINKIIERKHNLSPFIKPYLAVRYLTEFNSLTAFLTIWKKYHSET